MPEEFVGSSTESLHNSPLKQRAGQHLERDNPRDQSHRDPTKDGPGRRACRAGFVANFAVGTWRRCRRVARSQIRSDTHVRIRRGSWCIRSRRRIRDGSVSGGRGIRSRARRGRGNRHRRIRSRPRRGRGNRRSGIRSWPRRCRWSRCSGILRRPRRRRRSRRRGTIGGGGRW